VIKPQSSWPLRQKRHRRQNRQQDAAPTGKAYVVQLGALKNADKVNEVVGKLRSAGYRVYTSPSTPVQGKITRILVGPEASKDKLKGSLGELKQISGLSGVVMGYSANWYGRRPREAKASGVEHFFSAFFIYAREGNPYANVFFFC
jgi:hypothetical protein